MTKKKSQVDLSQGISAGIIVWLCFLLCFVFLDYPVPLSIILGGFGAVATTWLDACLKSDHEDVYELPKDTEVAMVKSSDKRTRLKEAYQKRQLEPIKTSKKTWKLTEYLFGKNKS